MIQAGLLDDLGHDDLIVAGLGGHFDKDLGGIGFARLVALAPDVENAVRVGHGFHAFDVDGVELIEIAEDVVELAAELGLLFSTHVEPRKIRDVIDVNVWCFGHNADDTK